MKSENVYIAAALTQFMRDTFLGRCVTLKSNYVRVRKPLKVVEISDIDYAEYSDTPEWVFTFENGRTESVSTWDTVTLADPPRTHEGK